MLAEQYLKNYYQMAKRLLFVVVLLTSLSLFSQERQMLTGKVLTEGIGLKDVYIINVTAREETKTNAVGDFTITAGVGDEIIVYNPDIMKRKFVLKEESFKSMPLVITVTKKAYELDEVVLDKYQGVDEVSLGLVPADQKRYTYAERHVYAATTGLIGPLINAITGRTKMLKKDVETERKKGVLADIKYIYPEEELMENLDMPKEYVEGFYYYAAESNRMARAVATKNEGMVRLLLTELAEEYLKLQKQDE